MLFALSLLAALLFLPSLLASPPTAPLSTAARITITVDTTQDELNNDGNCSLREAIQAANTSAPVDACPAGGTATVIAAPAGIYSLTLGGAGDDNNLTGDLDIAGNVSLVGAGAAATVIDGVQLDRVLQVEPGAMVAAADLTIRNGKAPDGVETPTGGTDGADGGGIANFGVLALTNVVVTGNMAGTGGNLYALGFATVTLSAGAGGRGGGIFNAGILTLTASTVSSNGAGASGRAAYAEGKPGGAGGGIYSSGAMTLMRTVVQANAAGHGDCAAMPPGILGTNGGHGGGIFNSGSLAVMDSSLTANAAGVGATCGGSHAVGGSGGSGGALYDQGRTMLMRSTLNANHAGSGGVGSWVLTTGAGGSGGAIYAAGAVTLNNSTLSDNAAGEPGVSTWNSHVGPSGNGGAIASTGNVTLSFVTLSGNQAPAVGTAGQGGGIYTAGTLRLRNTIIAGNQAVGGADCWGTLTSFSHNLVQNTAGCTLAGDVSGNLTGVNPLLTPLADFGGPTLTQAPAPGSPAINAGDALDVQGDSVTADQRGVARPQLDAWDMGAFETEGTITRIVLPVAARATAGR